MHRRLKIGNKLLARVYRLPAQSPRLLELRDQLAQQLRDLLSAIRTRNQTALVSCISLLSVLLRHLRPLTLEPEWVHWKAALRRLLHLTAEHAHMRELVIV